MSLSVIIFVTLAFNSVSGSTKQCNINDLDVNKCVLNALNSLRSHNGIKSSTYDPFVIPRIIIMQEAAIANFTAKGINFTVRGMDNFDIKYIRFDPLTMTFYGRVLYDPLSVDSVYEFKGHWVLIPIEGKGVAYAALGSIDATVEVHGEMIKDSGGEYYHTKELKIKMILDDIGVYFDGIFPQNAVLARRTNEALNANTKLLAHALTPVIEKMAEVAFLNPIKFIARNMLYIA